ncbi:phage tail protein [Hydrogenophaga sp.]|uniref:phage tail protein n=1 Tax=Hydrogenophaga sp. TaxID=1904254 RepID=UPI0025BDB60B|nr:phage tail protein [Hydrogenophaga sp.]
MNPSLCNNHFQVEWGGRRISFISVSGLSTEVEVTPFRESASRDGVARAVPGLQRFSPVVLTRSIEPGDNDFFQWMSTVRGSEAERRDVSIRLLNAVHEPVVTWRLSSAFPSRLDYGPLNALSSEVATESLTLVHEGLVVQHAG